MKTLFCLFLILLVGIAALFFMQHDSGFAVFSYSHWVVSSSLWVFLAALIIGFVAFYILIRVLKNIFLLPRRMKRARAMHKEKQIQKYIVRALESALAGYGEGVTQAVEKITKQNDKLFCVNLFSIRQMMQEKKHAQAVAVLQPMIAAFPKNNLLMSLLQENYCALQNYDALQNMLPQLKKLYRHDTVRFFEIQLFLLQHKIKFLSDKKEIQKTLDVAETWLKQYPENDRLLLVLARLYLLANLYGKARVSVEKSFALNASAEAELLMLQVQKIASVTKI